MPVLYRAVQIEGKVCRRQKNPRGEKAGIDFTTHPGGGGPERKMCQTSAQDRHGSRR